MCVLCLGMFTSVRCEDRGGGSAASEGDAVGMDVGGAQGIAGLESVLGAVLGPCEMWTRQGSP